MFYDDSLANCPADTILSILDNNESSVIALCSPDAGIYCDQYVTPSGPIILAVYELLALGHCIIIPPFAVIGTLDAPAAILYVGDPPGVGLSQIYTVEDRLLINPRV